MRLLGQMAALLLGLGFALGLGGCECTSKLGEYRVVVKLSDAGFEADSPSMQVDLVGVTPTERQQLEAYDVSKYFSADDAFRAGLLADGPNKVRIARTFRAGGERSYELVLNRRDPMFQAWDQRGVRALVVLADLARVSPGSQPSLWRGTLSLDKCDWGNRKELPPVEISPGRVTVPAPPEKK